MSITTILLSQADSTKQVQEALAVAAITPGHLVELTGTGTVQKHATAGGPTAKLVALRNVATAKGIDDAYAAAETTRYLEAKSGDEVYMFLINGAGQDIVANIDRLISNGDGNLKVAAGTETDERTVGITLDTIDNDPGSAAVRVRVRIL